jgi:hypothetical protein
MAKKTDNNAARERKQKIVVAVGGVLLAGLMVIQGPKLLDAVGGGSNSNQAAPAAAASPQSASTPTASAPTTGAVPATPSVVVNAPRSAKAELAGVVIVPEQPVQPGDGQLGSLSRFESKDPFVQKVDPDRLPTPAEVGNLPKQTAAAAKQAGQKSTSGASAANANANASGVQGVAGPTAAVPAVAPTIAILRVNGKLQTVALTKRFPRSDGAFVLRSLRPGRATIAVADGAFVGGGTLVLRVGRTTTLVNTATDARYVVTLVFVGAESRVTRFNSK